MNTRMDRRILTAERRQPIAYYWCWAAASRTLSALRELVPYSGLSVLVVVVYLTVARLQNGEFGFPLDDAWIHQVYARNIAMRGEFAFFPGQPSAGSTSPLWALSLAVGYALGFDARIWTVALGTLLLSLSALLSARISRHLGATKLVATWLVPVAVIFEWHLAWASVSGMEIPLFIVLSLALFDLLLASTQPFWIGIIAGLLTLTRPEGAVLGLIAAMGITLRAWRERPPAVERPRAGLLGRTNLTTPEMQPRGLQVRVANLPFVFKPLTFSVMFALLLIPYVVFNAWSSGTILPNTFYAKSQEYAELLIRSNLLARWIALYRQPFLGAQVLLLPGLAWVSLRFVRARQFEELIGLVWGLVLPGLYAVRLPVDYQFGRYEMPIIPFICIFGVVGTAELLARIRMRTIRRAWGLAIGVLAAVFTWLGANQYAGSVGIINCEMVATARWTAANLPPGALIAVHDIGAQGYFDSHPLLDLAGLVSPEVIPFIRDESRLRDWLTTRGASYAIFFPTWYPQMAREASFVPVHTENCAVTRAAGEVGLQVYRVTR